MIPGCQTSIVFQSLEQLLAAAQQQDDLQKWMATYASDQAITAHLKSMNQGDAVIALRERMKATLAEWRIHKATSPIDYKKPYSEHDLSLVSNLKNLLKDRPPNELTFVVAGPNRDIDYDLLAADPEPRSIAFTHADEGRDAHGSNRFYEIASTLSPAQDRPGTPYRAEPAILARVIDAEQKLTQDQRPALDWDRKPVDLAPADIQTLFFSAPYHYDATASIKELPSAEYWKSIGKNKIRLVVEGVRLNHQVSVDEFRSLFQNNLVSKKLRAQLETQLLAAQDSGDIADIAIKTVMIKDLDDGRAPFFPAEDAMAAYALDLQKKGLEVEIVGMDTVDLATANSPATQPTTQASRP